MNPMRQSNRMKLIVTFVAIAVCLILLLIAVLLAGRGQGDTPLTQTGTHGPQILDPVIPTITQGSNTNETNTTIYPFVTEPQNTEQLETKPQATEPQQTEPDETTHPTQDENEKPTETQPSQQKPNGYIFPYTIPGTDLVIEQVNSYNGIFFEDGSDREVSNVTAIVLTNTGTACIEYIRITIRRDGVPMRFVASSIEAGGTVVVLEADGKKFANGDYTDCTAESSMVSVLEMSQDRVRVEEDSMGRLIVTNIYGEDIPCIRIFYKFYMEDVDVYVGGITYTAKIVDLNAGESSIVTPSHYYPGYSKVVMVKIYDTAE